MQTIALTKNNFIDTVAVLANVVKQSFKIKISIEKKTPKKDFLENSEDFEKTAKKYIKDRKNISYTIIKENMNNNPNKFKNFISK